MAETLMGFLAPDAGRLRFWGVAVLALIVTMLGAFASRFLLYHYRRWKIMQAIPGISPSYPLLGNALLLEADGAGKDSQALTPHPKQVVSFLSKYQSVS